VFGRHGSGDGVKRLCAKVKVGHHVGEKGSIEDEDGEVGYTVNRK
jgi:hypothetical protein